MSKLRNSARGQQCQVRIPDVCTGFVDETVLAHLNGGGMGMKHSDIHGAFACFACHNWLDKDYVKTATRDERDLSHLQAIIRTQQIWLKEGLIKV